MPVGCDPNYWKGKLTSEFDLHDICDSVEPLESMVPVMT